MNDEKFTFWIIGIIIWTMTIWAFAETWGEKVIKRQAVKANVGYYTNDSDGNSIFKFKEIK